MQDSAASLAVPLAASLLGCLAVLALVTLVLALYVRHRRRRRGAASAQKKGEALPVTVSAGTQQQVQGQLLLLALYPLSGTPCTAHHRLQCSGSNVSCLTHHCRAQMIFMLSMPEVR